MKNAYERMQAERCDKRKISRTKFRHYRLCNDDDTDVAAAVSDALYVVDDDT